MPVACSSLQLDPETDWMYTADAGNAGLGLAEGRMMVPRGKMLGGSSGINYMAYVRGHPGDFDAWAADGATGWSYDEVLPYFKKSEGLAPSGDIVIDADAHNTEGPLGVSVRSPVHPRLSGFRHCRGQRRDSRRRLQRARPPGRRRCRLAASDHHPQREAVEHVPRLSRRRSRASPEPHCDHWRAGHRHRADGRHGRPHRPGRRVPNGRRHNGGPVGPQRGGSCARRRRLPADPAPVGHWPQE